MNLYNCKSAEGLGQFTITKFDADLNVESSYLVSTNGCECPQGHKPTCRHRKMLPLFLSGSDMTPTHVDTAWFLDFETKQWHCFEPQGEPVHESEMRATLPWRRL